MGRKEIKEKIDDIEKQLAYLKMEMYKRDELQPWKPEVSETYYYVNAILDSDCTTNCDSGYNYKCITIGNCFRTKERAEQVAEKFRMLLKMEQLHDMFCQDYVPAWYKDEKKWYVYFNTTSDEFKYGYTCILKDPIRVYFDSEETVQSVCDILNREMRSDNGKV